MKQPAKLLQNFASEGCGGWVIATRWWWATFKLINNFSQQWEVPLSEVLEFIYFVPTIWKSSEKILLAHTKKKSIASQRSSSLSVCKLIQWASDIRCCFSCWAYHHSNISLVRRRRREIFTTTARLLTARWAENSSMFFHTCIIIPDPFIHFFELKAFKSAARWRQCALWLWFVSVFPLYIHMHARGETRRSWKIPLFCLAANNSSVHCKWSKKKKELKSAESRWISWLAKLRLLTQCSSRAVSSSERTDVLRLLLTSATASSHRGMSNERNSNCFLRRPSKLNPPSLSRLESF